MSVTAEEFRQALTALSELDGESAEQQRLEGIVCAGLAAGTFGVQAYHNTFVRLLAKRLAGEIVLDELNQWPLLHALLRHVLLANVGVELCAIQMRRNILLQVIQQPASACHLQPLILSIAIQNYKNEYVHAVEADEQQALEQIQAQLPALVAAPVDDVLSTVLSVLCLYDSPLRWFSDSDIDLQQLAANAPELSAFVKQVFAQEAQEHQWAERFRPLQPSGDSVTRRVADMYAENPYPRWVETLHCMNPQAVPLEYFTGVATFPGAKPIGSIETILLAGCGTGRHPIQVALNYPWIKITAIDISWRSVGYAAMKAEEMGIKNIEFLVCDILDLKNDGVDGIARQYDMVDCIGVLHHLTQPEKGLQALCSRLRDNGLIRLGLYSQAARQAVSYFRENHAASFQPVSLSSIRAARKMLIETNDAHSQALFRLDDFYSSSGCRDLLFHEQETAYTIEGLQALLRSQNLQFLGLGMPHRQLVEAITEVCGVGADVHSLQNWQAVETQRPTIFSSMYNFFAQK